MDKLTKIKFEIIVCMLAEDAELLKMIKTLVRLYN